MTRKSPLELHREFYERLRRDAEARERRVRDLADQRNVPGDKNRRAPPPAASKTRRRPA